MKKFQLILLLLFLQAGSKAQTNYTKASYSVDTFVQRNMAALKIPGIALAVVENGKIIKLSTYGTANLEWDTRVTAHTNFQIASCTKLLTSTLLLKALHQQKISLDDPVGKFIDSIPEGWKDLKIKHLVSHSSGLKDFKGDNYLSTATIVKAIKDSALEYLPGKGQHYAQIDFMLMGHILEKIYGKPFHIILREEITQPLKMTDGAYDMEQRTGSFMHTDLIRQRATTYYDLGGKMKGYKFMYPYYYYTAGGYYASISDLANWAAGLDNGSLFPKAFSDGLIYARDSVNNKISSYTKVGWILEEENGVRYAGHSGGPGLADILRFPGQGYTFIVLANDGELLPSLARSIANFYIKKLPRKPELEKFDR